MHIYIYIYIYICHKIQHTVISFDYTKHIYDLTKTKLKLGGVAVTKRIHLVRKNN